MAKKGTSVRKRSSLLRATVDDKTGGGRVRESVRRDVAGTAEGGDDDDDDDDDRTRVRPNALVPETHELRPPEDNPYDDPAPPVPPAPPAPAS